MFLFFAAGNLFVSNYKPYALLLVFTAGLWWVATKNVTASVWYTILGSLLFFKAKYFIIPYVSGLAVSGGFLRATPFIYFISFFDVLLGVLLYLLIRNRWTYRVRKSLGREFVLLTLLLLVGAASSTVSPFSSVSWFSLFKVFEYVLLFFVSIILLSDARVFRVTFGIIILFITLNAALIVLQRFSGGPIGLIVEDVSTSAFGRFADELPGLYRPGGIYFEPNLPASLINLILPIMFFASIMRIKGVITIIARVGFIILISALVFTGSRANWIVAAISLLVSILFARVRGFVQKVSINRKTLLATVVLLSFLAPGTIARLSTIREAVTSEAGGWPFRLRHLAIAWEFMQEKFFGVGIDVFQYKILNSFPPNYYFSHFTAPHNIFAEIGSGFGVLGLGVSLGFFFVAYEKLICSVVTKNSTPGLSVMVLIGYSTYLLSAQFYPWLFAPPLSEISWIFLGGLYARLQNKSH